MSYAIIRNAKYKAANLQSISRHDERQNDEYGNKDIDTSRSNENYHLRKPHEKSYEKEFYRLKEENNLKGNLRLTGKKLSNIVCEFLITSDSDFFKSIGNNETTRFFESAYDFACQRCGEKNIISAVVHMDESTPHMHLTYIPVVKKKDKTGDLSERINCSEFWKGFNSYGILQDNFHAFITQRGFNLERGESKEEPVKHLSVKEYKEKTFREANIQAEKIINEAKSNVTSELYKLQKRTEDTERIASETLQNASLEADKIKKDIEHSRETLKRLESHIKTYEAAFDSASEIESMGKKSMVGGKVTFTAEEAENLKKQALAFWKAKSKADTYGVELTRLNDIAGRVRPLEDENRKLKKELEETKHDIDNIKDIIMSRPKLLEEYKEAEKQKAQNIYDSQRDLRKNTEKNKRHFEEL